MIIYKLKLMYIAKIYIKIRIKIYENLDIITKNNQ